MGDRNFERTVNGYCSVADTFRSSDNVDALACINSSLDVCCAVGSWDNNICIFGKKWLILRVHSWIISQGLNIWALIYQSCVETCVDLLLCIFRKKTDLFYVVNRLLFNLYKLCGCLWLMTSWSFV